MVGKLLAPEIKSLIAARDFNALRELFKEWPPADIAEIILDLPDDEQVIIFRVLPAALAADVFEYIGVEEQQQLLRAMARSPVKAPARGSGPSRADRWKEPPGGSSRPDRWWSGLPASTGR